MFEQMDRIVSMDDEARKALTLSLCGEMSTRTVDDAQSIRKEMETSSNPYKRVFMASWLLDVTGDGGYIDMILRTCINAEMSAYEKYFVYSQVVGMVFVNAAYMTDDTVELLDELYGQVYRWYESQITTEVSRIPVDERNRDFILVLTGQMLAIQHGPTKTILDRCKILKGMGKDVLLINLAVMTPIEHVVPMYRLAQGSHVEEYANLSTIGYEGVDIPYVQLPHGFPTVDQIDGLVQLVKEYKPYQIVSVDDGVVVDILDKLVPTLVVSLTPSELRRTGAQYLQIGRPVTDEDRVVLSRRGKNENNVIFEVFSSHLAPQTQEKTRDELGLPKDVKIGVVIGGRLNREVTPEFIRMVKPCLERGLWLMMLGPTEAIDDMIDVELGEYASQVIRPGMISDTLMYLDHAFVYLNPTRRGGGTSSVESMSKGVVPVTTRYGDVYVNVGEDFAVSDYAEMTDTILGYLENEEKWKEMSRRAVARAELMLDSDGAFRRVMAEYEKRMLAAEGM